MCRSEKFTNGHLTRNNLSSSAASFLIVINKGTSAPNLSFALTQTFETWMEPVPASAGKCPQPIVAATISKTRINQWHRVIEATGMITDCL